MAMIPGKKILFGCIAVLFALPQISEANLPDELYRQALSIAGKKVERTRAIHRPNVSALSSPTVQRFFGRYYQIGDTWDVVAFQFDSTMMRRTSEPRHLREGTGRGSVFRYEVIDVRETPKPEVVLRITQLPEELGLKPVDPRVRYLQLKMSDEFVQTRKSYAFHGRTDLFEASSDQIHTDVSVLELFPLDVPEIMTAESEKITRLPELPESMRKIAVTASYRPDLKRSVWLEQDDFFGRPVQILWQQGDPWPAYLKTVNGVAILIRKRTSS